MIETQKTAFLLRRYEFNALLYKLNYITVAYSHGCCAVVLKLSLALLSTSLHGLILQWMGGNFAHSDLFLPFFVCVIKHPVECFLWI